MCFSCGTRGRASRAVMLRMNRRNGYRECELDTRVDARLDNRRRTSRSHLAALPQPLHARRTLPRAVVGRAVRGHARSYGRSPTKCGEVAAQLSHVVHQISGRFPDVAAVLEEAAPDIAAFSMVPTAHWR